MALLLWQPTFCSGILGVTLLMQVLQGSEPGLIPNHLTGSLGMEAVFPTSAPAEHYHSVSLIIVYDNNGIIIGRHEHCRYFLGRKG